MRGKMLILLLLFSVTADAVGTGMTEPDTMAQQVVLPVVRVGYIDRDSVMNLMPETERIARELMTLEQEYKDEYDVMVRNYNKKVKAYIEKDRELNETIRLAHQSEITEMEGRIGRYKESYLKALEQYRSEAYGPLNEKVDNAIKQVAQEQGITILFDSGTPLYMSPLCVDIMPYVKAVLGLE